MEIQLNKESFSYSRFCMHLRYLVQRMMHGNPLNADNAMDSMFVTMRNEYPQVYACVQQIDTFAARHLRVAVQQRRAAVPHHAYPPRLR